VIRRPTKAVLILLALLLGTAVSSCRQISLGTRRLAPTDTTTSASAHRLLVFSEAMSANGSGPSFVTLDSGAVYRLFIDGDAEVVLSAREQSRPPPRAARILFGEQAVPVTSVRLVQALHTRPALLADQVPLSHVTGIPFEAPTGGEYRVETMPGTGAVVLVRIFREEADNLSARCVGDPHANGCRGADDRSSRPSRSGVLTVIGAFLVPAIAWAIGPH
jgi:hypothetical protein